MMRLHARAEELAVVRLAVGAFAVIYLATRLPQYLRGTRLDPGSFAPVGPVSLLDSPLPPAVAGALLVGTLLLALPFTLGWRFSITGPVFALLMLWCTSYRSSFGMTFHSENLLVWHTLVLGLAPAADAWSLDARRRGAAARAATERYGWPLLIAAAVTAAVYLVAGVAKLKGGGIDWVLGDLLRNHIAYNALRKAELGDGTASITAFVLSHGWILAPMAWGSLLLELTGPIALLWRRFAIAWAAGMFAFHWGIVVVMDIQFPYPMSAVPFAPLFTAELTAGLRSMSAWARRRTGTPTA